MIEDGKISAEDGLKLMQALGDAPDQDQDQTPPPGDPDPIPPMGEPSDDFEFERMTQKFRKLWMIPFYIGIAIVLISASLMYYAIQSSGFGFWLFCASLPFMLGMIVLTISATSHNARWIFVDVNEQGKKGKSGAKFVIGFPMPLGLIAWFFRTFGNMIPDLRDAPIDEMIIALDKSTGETPLIVNVDEGDHGDKVRVFIG
jgi:hypothetical protein